MPCPLLRSSAVWMLLIALVALLPGAPPAQIPDVPEDATFSNDYGGIIHQSEYDRIGSAQQTAYEQHNTPIIVVTIPSMAAYGYGNRSIEEFAELWFNKWEIGTLDREQGGANKGVMLLVSVGDRKARIELGADWGRDWDDYCKTIMDKQIIPEFKKGDYSGGIANGVEALAEMAAIGPEAEAPVPSTAEKIRERATSSEPLTPMTMIPGNIAIILIILGVGLIILSIFLPDYRKPLMIAGFVLIGIAVLMWIIIFVFALLNRGRRGSSGGFGGGGFSSGGGFGGGFSGGGGASGSW